MLITKGEELIWNIIIKILILMKMEKIKIIINMEKMKM